MTKEPRDQNEPMYDSYSSSLGRNVAPFQVGFDSVSFSSPEFYDPSHTHSFPTRFDVPENAGTFHRKTPAKRRPTQRFPWTLRAEYVHEPDGHRLILFTDRSRLWGPRAFLKLIPGPGRLLSPHMVCHFLAPIAAHFRLDLKVSQIELAADFDVDSTGFERLGGMMWVPKTSWPKRVGKYDPTFYWGSRRSASQTKLYMKNEAGQRFARLEHTIRRSALHRMKVNHPTDLFNVDWGRVASRRGRFVEVDIGRPTRQSRFLIIHLRAFIRILGLQTVLGPAGPRYQRWIKSRFVPLPVQAKLEAALTTLSAPKAASFERQNRFEK